MKVSQIFTRTMWIGLAIAIGLYIAIHYVFSPIIDPLVRTLIFWAGVPLGVLAGGYYIGRQLGAEILQSILVAVLDLLILLVMGQIPLNPILLVVTLAAGPLGMVFAQRMPYSTRGTVFSSGGRYPSGNRTVGSRPPVRPRFRLGVPGFLEEWMSRLRANRHYDQLLRLVRMDRETADGLIEFERRRTPYASRETLILNAIDRLNRDRH